jgi:hypothetical protein
MKHSPAKKIKTCKDCGAIFNEDGTLNTPAPEFNPLDQLGQIKFEGIHRYMDAIGHTKVRDFNCPVECPECDGFGVVPDGINKKTGKKKYINCSDCGGSGYEKDLKKFRTIKRSQKLMAKAYEDWKVNVRKNIKWVNKHQKHKVSHLKHEGEPAYIIGSGPSLKYNYKELARIKRGVIIAQNASAQLVKNPDYYTAMDYECRDWWWEGVDFSKTFGVLGLKVSSKVHKLNFKDKVFMLPTGSDQFCNAHTNNPKLDMVDHGCHTTYSAFCLAFMMGCNPIVFVGCDYAFTDDNVHINEKKTDEKENCKHAIPKGQENKEYPRCKKCKSVYDKAKDEWVFDCKHEIREFYTLQKKFPVCKKCGSVYDKKHDIWSYDGVSFCQQMVPILNDNLDNLIQFDFAHMSELLYNFAFTDGIAYGNDEYMIQVGVDGKYTYTNRQYAGAVNAMICQAYFISQKRVIINASERGIFFESGFFQLITNTNLEIQKDLQQKYAYNKHTESEKKNTLCPACKGTGKFIPKALTQYRSNKKGVVAKGHMNKGAIKCPRCNGKGGKDTTFEEEYHDPMEGATYRPHISVKTLKETIDLFSS